MTNVTESNPTGITEFDIHEWSGQPEWPVIAQAVNEMVLRVAREESIGLPDEYEGRAQDYLADALGHLARGVAFMDSCSQCDRETGAAGPRSSVPPFKTEIEGNWLHGTYRCAAGHEWTCGYALERPAF